MLIKKSKPALLGMAVFAAITITSCNNEPKATEEKAADTTAAPAPAPADASATPADTTKLDTATTRPIKNPG